MAKNQLFDIDEVIALRKAQMTWAEIGEVLGVNATEVRKITMATLFDEQYNIGKDGENEQELQ